VAILVTGTPGVGKTTVSLELARKTGKNYVDIADIVKREKFYKGYDDVTDSLIVDTAKLKKYLRNLLTCNEVIDTHVVEAVPQEKVTHVFVLRLDPVQLMKRLEQRGYRASKIRQNVEAEILDSILIDSVKLFGTEKVFEINTTGKDVSEIVQIIYSILQGNVEEFKPGNVNWLQKYYFLLEQQ
jgi:adenylate kinase